MKVIRQICRYGYNKWILMIATVVLIGGFAFFGCYKFENSNLKIKMGFNYNAQCQVIYIDKQKAKSGESCKVSVKPSDAIMEEIIVLRNGIELRKITNMNISEYFSEIINDNGEKSYISTDAWAELVRNTSASFKEERVLAAASAWIIYLIIWIVVCMHTYNHYEDFMKYIKRNSTLPGDMIRFVQDIKKYSYYILYSAKTDLKAEVANSYLNWFWWILEPFCNMLVYVVVFGQVLGTSIENYAIFIFSGLLMWNFFNKSILNSVKIIRSNRDIVTKVYIPKFVLILSNMFLNLFKLLFSLLVLLGLMVFFSVKVDWHVIFVPAAYLIMFIYSFGCSMILMHFGVFIDDLAYAISILMQMLMFLSGIFYRLETGLPEPLNKVMLYCNPAAMLINTVRNGLLYQTGPDLILLIVWFFLSGLLCVIGIHVIYRNENSYVKVV